MAIDIKPEVWCSAFIRMAYVALASAFSHSKKGSDGLEKWHFTVSNAGLKVVAVARWRESTITETSTCTTTIENKCLRLVVTTTD